MVRITDCSTLIGLESLTGSRRTSPSGSPSGARASGAMNVYVIASSRPQPARARRTARRTCCTWVSRPAVVCRGSVSGAMP